MGLFSNSLWYFMILSIEARRAESDRAIFYLPVSPCLGSFETAYNTQWSVRVRLLFQKTFYGSSLPNLHHDSDLFLIFQLLVISLFFECIASLWISNVSSTLLPVCFQSASSLLPVCFQTASSLLLV